MVVVAIMAVLASVGFVSYGSVKKKGNDSKRKADLSSLVTALEMMKNDIISLPAGADNAACEAGELVMNGAGNTLQDLCTAMILNANAKIPAAPTATAGYQYQAWTADLALTNYCVSAQLELPGAGMTHFKCINGSCTEAAAACQSAST